MKWLGMKAKMYPAYTTGVEILELPEWLSPDDDPDTPLNVKTHEVSLDRWAVAPGEVAAWRYTIWNANFLCAQLTDEELQAAKEEWWWHETVMMLNRCPNCGAGWTDRWGAFCPLCGRELPGEAPMSDKTGESKEP